MGKINFFSLGGIQENGKDLYIVEVSEKLYILDCGLKYPTAELYGVDVIVNDVTFIEENLDRVEGIFLTNAHDNHIGGLTHLINDNNKNKLKIYGSRFTLAVLKEKLDEDKISIDSSRLIAVTPKTALHFDRDNVVVRFFEVSNNIPESYGIALKTLDGYIIYTGNYNFDQNSKIDYAHMFRSLAVFSKEGVLALLTESLGANNEQSRGTILEFKLRITNLISQTKHRIIFSLFSSDILRIQQICDIAIENNKKIAIIGRKTQKIVNQAINLGYLNIPEKNFANLKFIEGKNDNNLDDLVVIVTGERHEPYFMLQRMARSIDRLIHLDENDTVVILANPYLGTEKMAARTLDIVYHVTSNVKVFNSNLLPEPDANREEIKQMINILNPKYIIPVTGEYRHQYALRIVADCIGYKDDKLLIVDNGDIIEFTNGVYTGIKGDVASSEVLVDGKAFKDVNDVVMRDRELLASNGLILISANINPRTKEVILEPEIVTRGFIYAKENGDIIEQIKETFYEVSKKYLATKFINWSDFKTGIKNEVSHLVYKMIKRNPIIIPILISIDFEYIAK